MTQQTYEYNHELSQRITDKVKIEEWYKQEVKNTNLKEYLRRKGK